MYASQRFSNHGKRQGKTAALIWREIMEGIPFINIMAIIHLCFIAALVGTVLTENTMELNMFMDRKKGIGVSKGYLRLFRLLSRPDSFKSVLSQDTERELHHVNIRNHYWIDIMVEVPLAVGVIVSGIIMAILVDRLSVLHITKIALASCSMIGLAFCVKGVLRRNRILQGSPTEEGIIREARKMYLTALTAECLLIPILVLGFWLGYHRILDSIY